MLSCGRRSIACDALIAVTPGVAADLEEHFGADPALMAVISTPANLAEVQAGCEQPLADAALREDVPIVLFVGRLERVKGLEYLLRAAAKVLESQPMQLVLVGSGSQAGYLKALAKHLGIADCVYFAGEQSNPFAYMRRATAFVLSSLSEGMPNVLLEAMACGCPVIATDIEGGITRQVLQEGEAGMIVPKADADSLADAIDTLLLDEELRERLSERGLARTRDFDLPKIVSAYEELLIATAERDPLVLRRTRSDPRRRTADRQDACAAADHADGRRVHALPSLPDATSRPRAIRHLARGDGTAAPGLARPRGNRLSPPD